MEHTNEFRIGLEELKNAPYYNFTQTFVSSSNEDMDSPYDDIILNCEYFDNDEFINRYKENTEYSLISWNIQGLNAKLMNLRILLISIAQTIVNLTS